eukprot:scaffold323459_cov15-Tisochrysis_lutea.AAC.1
MVSKPSMGRSTNVHHKTQDYLVVAIACAMFAPHSLPALTASPGGSRGPHQAPLPLCNAPD